MLYNHLTSNAYCSRLLITTGRSSITLVHALEPLIGRPNVVELIARNAATEQLRTPNGTADEFRSLARDLCATGSPGKPWPVGPQLADVHFVELDPVNPEKRVS